MYYVVNFVDRISDVVEKLSSYTWINYSKIMQYILRYLQYITMKYLWIYIYINVDSPRQ